MNYHILAIALSMGACIYWGCNLVISFIQVAAWAWNKSTVMPKTIGMRMALFALSVALYWYLTF